MNVGVDDAEKHMFTEAVEGDELQVDVAALRYPRALRCAVIALA